MAGGPFIQGPPACRSPPPTSQAQESGRHTEKRQAGRFRHLQGAEQASGLAIDAVEEIQRVGVAATARTAPKHQWPQPPRRVAGAYINRDGPQEVPGHRIERVDFALDEAEIADQQIAAESA